MQPGKRLILALQAGALAGGLVLGVLGRLATASLAVAAGYHANLSARGILEAAVLGAVAGAAGGVLLHALRRARRTPDAVPGIAAGAAVFAGTLLLAWAGGRLVFTWNGPLPATLAAAGVACLAYGAAANALLSRFERRGGATGR